MSSTIFSGVGHQVLVRVPAEAIKSPEDFGKMAAAAFAKGGCPSCYSGLDFRFAQVRDFVVNPKTLELKAFTPTEG